MQALNTLNDPVFMEASQFFARKYEVTGDAFIKKGYFEIFGKPISENKLAKLKAFYANMLTYYSKNNKETLAFLKLCPDNDVPKNPAVLVAKTLVANALFNIDESINKP